MNIRQCRGNSRSDKPSFLYIVPASQVIFLAAGMLVPATDRRGLGSAKEHPSFAAFPAALHRLPLRHRHRRDVRLARPPRHRALPAQPHRRPCGDHPVRRGHGRGRAWPARPRADRGDAQPRRPDRQGRATAGPGARAAGLAGTLRAAPRQRPALADGQQLPPHHAGLAGRAAPRRAAPRWRHTAPCKTGSK